MGSNYISNKNYSDIKFSNGCKILHTHNIKMLDINIPSVTFKMEQSNVIITMSYKEFSEHFKRIYNREDIGYYDNGWIVEEPDYEP